MEEYTYPAKLDEDLCLDDEDRIDNRILDEDVEDFKSISLPSTNSDFSENECESTEEDPDSTVANIKDDLREIDNELKLLRFNEIERTQSSIDDGYPEQ